MEIKMRFLKMIKLLSLALLVTIISCGQNETAVEKEVETLPPSMRSDDEGLINYVTLTNEQAENLKIKTEVVQKSFAVYPINASAVVEPSPDHVSIISAPIEGLIVKIYAHKGDPVKKGQVLLELESLEFADLIASLIRSSAEEKFRKNNFQRMQSLYDQKIKSRRELEQSENEYERARASARASVARLLAVGLTQKEIQAWQEDPDRHPHLAIRADRSGWMTEHLVEHGQAVNRYDRMGMIVNTDKLLVKGYVSPEDADFIDPEIDVTISLRKSENKQLKTKIHSIVPVLDEQNRSVVVNAFVTNPDSWLTPGRNVRMQIEGSTAEKVIHISKNGLLIFGDQPTVFVKVSDNKFEQRPIKIAQDTGSRTVVYSGLTAGEEIAVSQVFSLKALAKYTEEPE
ncbi:MAG: efflux RND transporter periplasmic adaptor subunit [Calditrichaeota bacterium]|nr:MAG: efflux RND transporter periplasmic adaptor subunit [Calditrichota bacterium]MBL1207352.1 efflux RND transporter periplasmic adaptor subunit [Calditrichota bacterium]